MNVEQNKQTSLITLLSLRGVALNAVLRPWLHAHRLLRSHLMILVCVCVCVCACVRACECPCVLTNRNKIWVIYVIKCFFIPF
jgi:hypothetical protein